MSGANTIHKRLLQELKNYITSQYFDKAPILMDALQPLLDREGVLYRKPFIESSPPMRRWKTASGSPRFPTG